MEGRIGQQWGSYRLLRCLGRGGFAEVYLGQHIRLASKQAALKILSTRLSEEYVQSFRYEAETIASLDHPHIVQVTDFDLKEGIPFLVIDYAPNGSLRQRHRRGEIVPLGTVVSYIQQAAEGLQYAHDHKIIHRDIKPDNLLIGARGEILLTDFGIATIAHNTSSQNMQGVSGTIPYMAPEQIQEHPRPASDQYALAITVYEWLTGRLPFSGTSSEVAVKHMTVPPPPLGNKVPGLSSDVEQVVLTALAKDPKTRFESVQAFAKALAEASHSRASESAIITPPIQQSSGQIPPTIPARPASRPVAIPLTTTDMQSPSPRTQVPVTTPSEMRATPLPALPLKFYPTSGVDSHSSGISEVKEFTKDYIRAMGILLIVPLSGLLGLILGVLAVVGIFLLIPDFVWNMPIGVEITFSVIGVLIVALGLVLGVFAGVKGARRLRRL